MENIERYYKRLDDARERENFLEKEMLDADVRHLEARTGFFDKLAILAAGSLAVAVPFLASTGEHNSLRFAIQNHWHAFAVSLGALLLCLVLCVLYNVCVNFAVEWLSVQLEWLYKEARRWREWCQNTPIGDIPHKGDAAAREMEESYGKSIEQRTRKDSLIKWVKRIGHGALICFVIGYAVGVPTILWIVVKTK